MAGFAAAFAMLVLGTVFVGSAYVVQLGLAAARDPLSVTQFTGGLPPVEHAVSRYHVRWYTVAMLFLAFDMEMVFMYPWTLVITTMGPSAVIEMFTFLFVLFVGVVYAWREGALRWV